MMSSPPWDPHSSSLLAFRRSVSLDIPVDRLCDGIWKSESFSQDSRVTVSPVLALAPTAGDQGNNLVCVLPNNPIWTYIYPYIIKVRGCHHVWFIDTFLPQWHCDKQENPCPLLPPKNIPVLTPGWLFARTQSARRMIPFIQKAQSTPVLPGAGGQLRIGCVAKNGPQCDVCKPNAVMILNILELYVSKWYILRYMCFIG